VTIAHVAIGTKRICPRYTSGTVTKRRPDAQQRRRELCDAAIELLAQDGARGLTHLRVDRRAGVTELYDVPPSSVWSDIVDLAGGTGPLVERAHAHAEARHPLQALHLTDIVLGQSPGDAAALRVKRAALEQLLAASGRENHREVQWLEQEIRSTTPEEGR
jgi:hypothetical protein